MKDRILPAGAEQWSEDCRGVLRIVTPAAASADGVGPPNILYTIAHHPTLLPPFLGFAAALAMRGVLPRRESEILALRASWSCQSAFEWGHHAEYGLAEGLSQAEIANIAGGPAVDTWSARDQLLLRAADELHADYELSDELFAALQDAFSDAEIVEITFVVGNYTMLSMVANATGVPLEARLPKLPER